MAEASQGLVELRMCGGPGGGFLYTSVWNTVAAAPAVSVSSQGRNRPRKTTPRSGRKKCRPHVSYPVYVTWIKSGRTQVSLRLSITLQIGTSLIMDFYIYDINLTGKVNLHNKSSIFGVHISNNYVKIVHL